MAIEARKVPWSSVVGQIVTLHDETGRAVAQLGIRVHTDAAGDQDIKSCAGHTADWTVKAFSSLAALDRISDMIEVMETKRVSATAASKHYPSREQWLLGEADAYEDAADELRDLLAALKKQKTT
jgi:hypothetical protein